MHKEQGSSSPSWLQQFLRSQILHHQAFFEHLRCCVRRSKSFANPKDTGMTQVLPHTATRISQKARTNIHVYCLVIRNLECLKSSAIYAC